MEVTEPMKITDVNIDCLEIVFKYLNLEDLSNIADSNKHLRNAAKLAFTSKYRKRCIHVCCTESLSERVITYRGAGQADEQNLKMSLQTLRCFGELISCLEVTCYTISNRTAILFQRLLDYISEYCVASLREITINRCPKGAWDRVQTPFLGVRKVLVNSSLVRGDILNRLFPGMRYFFLENICTVYPLKDLDHHYPNMVATKISADPEYYIQCYGSDAFEAFFRLNPQIRSLKMPFMANEYVQFVNKHLPSLKDLELLYGGCRPDTNGDEIRFKSVTRFKVESRRDELQMIPTTFDGLEEFSLEMRSLKDNRKFYEFIEKHPTIRKLSITHKMPMMSEKNVDVSRLVSTLPFLREIDLRFWKFTADKAIYVMKNAKHLKTFYFTLFKDSDEESFESRKEVISMKRSKKDENMETS